MRTGKIRLWRRPLRAPLVMLLTAAGLALSLWLLSGLYSRALPYASLQAEAAATTAVSAIINEVLAEDFSNAQDMLKDCTLESISGGELRSVTVDSAKINSVRAGITAEIIRRLEKMKTVAIKVPVGSLIGPELLFGRGPSIKIKLPARGSVKTDVGNSFISAGINQTRHIISVNIRVELILSLPDGGSISTEVETSSVLAQFVIIGHIPSAVLSS